MSTEASHKPSKKTTTNQVETNRLLELTTSIISAYVGQHSIQSDKLSLLIRDVHSTLTDLLTSSLDTDEHKNAIIEKTIFPDYIICLEDGKKLKILKRHLQKVYNISPEEYKKRWNLPPDYPMVAPNYAKRRSELAKEMGLGKHKTSEKMKV